MVNVWVVSRDGNLVTLNVVDEAGSPVVIDIDQMATGNGWTTNRCGKITDNVQRNYLDDVIDRDALPVGDPDKTATAAQLAATYGGWFVELNTQGNSNEIRLRTTTFRLFPVDANGNEVANGVSFNFEFTDRPR